MRLRARLERAQRVLGAPSEPEVFARAYEKYSNNILRMLDRHQESPMPLTAVEIAALKVEGIDGLATWLMYGTADEAGT